MSEAYLPLTQYSRLAYRYTNTTKTITTSIINVCIIYTTTLSKKLSYPQHPQDTP